MSKFKESELSDNLKEFQNNCSIEIEFEKSLSGKLKLDNATIIYNNKDGFISIENEKTKLKINTTLVYKYERIKDIVYIDLDCVMLKIKKII